MDGNIYERFWAFLRPEGYTAKNLAEVLLNKLDVLEVPTQKLIAQGYDGAYTMIGNTKGVQNVVKTKYPNAHYVHCYAHQFNLLLEKAASSNKTLKKFFANIQSFATFFSRSTNRIRILDDIVSKRLPRSVPTHWNFKTRTVNTLYEYKNLFIECSEKIVDIDADSKTISEATALLSYLKSKDFNFLLEVFHNIMPHVEMLFNQLQCHGADGTFIKGCINNFENPVVTVREDK